MIQLRRNLPILLTHRPIGEQRCRPMVARLHAPEVAQVRSRPLVGLPFEHIANGIRRIGLILLNFELELHLLGTALICSMFAFNTAKLKFAARFLNLAIELTRGPVLVGGLVHVPNAGVLVFHA